MLLIAVLYVGTAVVFYTVGMLGAQEKQVELILVGNSEQEDSAAA